MNFVGKAVKMSGQAGKKSATCLHLPYRLCEIGHLPAHSDLRWVVAETMFNSRRRIPLKKNMLTLELTSC